MKHHTRYAINYKENVEKFEKQLEMLKRKREMVQYEVEKAERNLEKIKVNVEEWCLEVDKVIDQEKKKVENLQDKAKDKCFIGLCPNFRSRYQLSRRADEVASTFRELIKVASEFSSRVSYHDVPVVSGLDVFSGDFEAFDSRKEVFNSIMGALKDDDDDVDIIGVHGMAGVGKNWLVREVARQVKMENLFDSVVMVSVSQNPDIRKIQDEIAGLVGINLGRWGKKFRRNGLMEGLKRIKKILVVLDDIWEELDLIDEVGIPFGAQHKGCKILLTSRDRDVLQRMDAATAFEVGVLEPKEAWQLFEKVIQHRVEESSELHSVAVKIVEKCAGLPVAIATLATALRNKPFLSQWEDALSRLQRPSSTNFRALPDHVTSAIRYSYDHLESEELRETFILCSLLGHDASVECLLRYMIGLGLVHDVNTIDEARNRVLAMISKLKASSLLHDSYSDDHFDMHDLIHDVALAIASRDHQVFALKEDDVLINWSDQEVMKDCISISLRFAAITELPDQLKCPQLTFFYMGSRDSSTNMKPYFFKETKNLKVLDLTKMHLSPLPSSISLLSNLQTLSLDECVLGDIAIVGELKNLQILSLSRSDIKMLPKEVGKLSKLKVLDLSHCTKLQTIPPGVLSSLSRLEELYMEFSWERHGIGRMTRMTIQALKLQLKKISIDQYHLDRVVTRLLNKTEDLYLGDLEGIKIVSNEFGNREGFLQLKNLHIRDSWETQFIVDDNNHTTDKIVFHQLQSLTLESLPQLIGFCSKNRPEDSTAIPQHEELPLFDEKVFFPCLEKLRLSSISVERIWQNTSDNYCSQNLTSLIIQNCGNLKRLLSSSMARSLVHLKYFEIVECRVLEEIIFTEDHMVKGKEATISFPELSTLKIRDLQHLTRFCSKNYKIQFPCLKLLEIEHCPKLKEFVQESTKEAALFDEKVAFPRVEKMTISHLRNLNVIWHEQLSSDSFHKLKTLEVKGCDELLTIFPSNMLRISQGLQFLMVSNCDSLEGVFHEPERLNMEDVSDKIVAMQLRELDIVHLPKLKYIWSKDPQGASTFHNLRSIHVKDCWSLRNVLPASVAASLPQLEDLHIESCGVEEIVSKIVLEGSERPITFEFNRVSSLVLCNLKKLKCFYPGRHTTMWPMLKKLDTQHCNQVKILYTEHSRIDDPIEQPLFWVEKVIPGLEEASLNSDDIAMIHDNQLSVESLFLKTKILKVRCYHDESAVFPFSFLQRFDDLEQLEVSCCNFKELLPGEGDVEMEKPITQTLPQIRLLKLSDLHKLSHIWKQGSRVNQILPNLEAVEVKNCGSLISCGPYLASFKSISTLEVSECQSMVNIFTSSTGQNLVHLTKMRIRECNLLREVFANEGEGRATSEIVFSKLKYLELHCLMNLTSFYSGKGTFHFPSLEQVIVRECSKMKIFCSGVLSTPKLQRVQQSEEDQKGCWFGDLNATIPNLFIPSLKVKFHGIEQLELSRFPELKETWNDVSQKVINFKRLKYLEIYNCRNLRYIFSPSMAMDLVYLENLEIFDCMDLEEVITRNGTSKEERLAMLFPRLVSFRLIALPLLTRFCSGPCFLKFPSMERIWIQNCPVLETIICNNENGRMLSMGNIEENNSGSDKQALFDEQTESSEADKFTYKFNQSSTKFPSLDFQSPGACCGDSDLIELFQSEGVHEWAKAQVWELRLFKLDKMRHIWKEEFQPGELFQNLITLKVSECSALKILVPSSVSFTNLTTLEIVKCGGFLNLITPSTAETMAQLQTLKISHCKLIQEIVAPSGDGIVLDDGTIICFTKLKYIGLQFLPCLTSFSSASYTFKFPALDQLIVKNCPNLEKFTMQDDLEASLLRKVCLSEEEDNWHWSESNSLNTTIKELHLAQKVERMGVRFMNNNNRQEFSLDVYLKKAIGTFIGVSVSVMIFFTYIALLYLLLLEPIFRCPRPCIGEGTETVRVTWMLRMIWRLIDKLKKLSNSTAVVKLDEDESTTSSSSSRYGFEVLAMTKLITSYNEDIQQEKQEINIPAEYHHQQVPTPTSSVPFPPISEERKVLPLTDSSNIMERFQVRQRKILTDHHGDQASSPFRRTNLVDWQLLPRDSTSKTMEDIQFPSNEPKLKRARSFDEQLLKSGSIRKWSIQYLDDHIHTTTNQPIDASDEIKEENTNFEEKSVTVLFEDLLNKLAKPLLSQRKLDSLMLNADVSSSGKVILLWTLYNSGSIKERFHFRAWINVSEVSNVVEAILEKAKQGKEEELRYDPSSSRQRLHDFLVWRRFLIVLYGIEAGSVWDDLNSVFPNSLNGSRVIIATIPSTDGSANTCGYLEEADSNVIRAKAVLNELTEAILGRRRLLFLISVVGAARFDKTSLLWPIYNAEDVKDYFDCCAWVHFAEVRSLDDVLAKIWEQVTNIKMYIRPPGPLQKLLQPKLHKFLSKKRYLVVLYDVWSAELWNELKVCFPNTLNGSRVILAVHSVDVARRTKSWIFSINPGKEMSVDESGKNEKRWDKLADIRDEASDMVGLEDKVEELAALALGNCNTPFVISVLGAAGSGKTTLAKEKQSLSVEQLRQGIRHFLTWKRYLIVLDDVRTSDIWKTLNLDFQNSSSSSKVILTTRDTFLARHINTVTAIIQQRLLTDEESWKLFLKKLETSNIDVNDPRLSNLKVKILRRCRGLPLQIVVLGGLLSTKDYDGWGKVIEEASQKRDKEKGVHGKDQMKSSGPLKFSDQLNSSNTKQTSKQHKPVSPSYKKITVEDQSNSAAQSSNKQKEGNKKTVVTDQQATCEGQSNSLSQEELPSDFNLEDQKGKLEVIAEDATAREDEEDENGNSGIKATDSDNQSISSEETTSLDNLLGYGYDDLDIQYKWCLLYVGLFPKDYKIPVRRLLLLWLAEGLVTVQPDGKTPLEEAEHYFQVLEKRSLIEIKEEADGSPKTCNMPNALREKLFPITEKVGFFHFKGSSDHKPQSQSQQFPLGNDFTVRRLAESGGMFIDTKPEENCLRLLRSYISFYNKEGDAPTSGVNELLKKIAPKGSAMLVVLDLERVYKPVLPETLGSLPFLRYLNLRRTHLDSIPESVGDLPHLETLDIKYTYIIKLPGTIWKAKKLQHLYMSEIYIDFSVEKASQACVSMEKPTDSESLGNLQILWGLIIRKKTPKRKLLQGVKKLKKLKLTCDEGSIDDIAAWISTLSNLESLKLRSISESSEPAKLELQVDMMTNFSKLKQLYLLGQLPKPIEVISKLPQGLEMLTLSVSRLEDDPMEMLGKLEKLKVLRLYANSYTGKTMTCHPGGFPELRILKLWMLMELENWILQENAMKELRKVEIRCCKNLKNVEGLEKLEYLTELSLTIMEDEFVNDFKQRFGSKVVVTPPSSLKFNSPWATLGIWPFIPQVIRNSKEIKFSWFELRLATVASEVVKRQYLHHDSYSSYWVTFNEEEEYDGGIFRTATIALGILSNDLGNIYEEGDKLDSRHQLSAFWAPFFLLHLGGPDTISAYSLEDNELYLRHLFGLLVQTLVTGYILLMGWTASIVSYQGILMIIVGSIKYGERTWALWKASSNELQDSMLSSPDHGPNYAKLMDEYSLRNAEGFSVDIEQIEEKKPKATDEKAIGQVQEADHNYSSREKDLMIKADELFQIFKRLFADLILSYQEKERSLSLFQDISRYEDAFDVIAIELGFMYDLLYTKAVVIYTRWGIFRRVVTSCITIAVLVVFYFDDWGKYETIDVVITFLLLVGAILLEIYAALALLLSDWSKRWLFKNNKSYKTILLALVSCLEWLELKLLAVINRLKLLVRPICSNCMAPMADINRLELLRLHRWSNGMAQFCLLGLFLNEKPGNCIWRKLLRWKLLEKYRFRLFERQRYRYVKKVDEDLKKQIFQHVVNKFKEFQKQETRKDHSSLRDLCSQRGKSVLAKFKEKISPAVLEWSVTTDFDESILIWHIATEICSNTEENADDTTKSNLEMSQQISRYMFYLLAVYPYMLPTGIGLIRLRDTRAEAEKFFEERLSTSKTEKMSRTNACKTLLNVKVHVPPIKVKGDRSKSVLFDACNLALELNKITDKKVKWEIIRDVWLEMLTHAANQCNGIEHGQQLRRGGELLTHVWLLMAHYGMIEQFQISEGNSRALLITK
ncbi:Disease resistance protein [Corchorus capsularis]|uniref:Disease resistance protein n=1 Tax=Corchorus capsularis TaxID=210143 RepID=A0A1R3GWC4_COCAP|nr:Disease resistance protein [Corchorus capsularis]